MKGLLLKDMMVLKKQGALLAILVAVYGVYSVASGDNSVFGSIIMLLGAMLPITAMAYDEQANWDKLALAMPVSRAALAVSKYIMSVITIGIATLCNLAIQWLIGGRLVWEDIMTILILSALGFLFVAILFPLMYRFGVEKSRLMIIGVVLVPVLLILLAKSLGIPMPDEAGIKKIVSLIPVISLAALLLSMLVSISICQHKEY
ncbi:MAG: ABC-2 transporter permease [Oscillospiraceae bacterium]|jgi:ABC-2 type transport system permease protein